MADSRFLPGSPTPEFVPKNYYLGKILAKNCMKIKEIGPRGGRASLGSASDTSPRKLRTGTNDIHVLVSKHN